MMHRLRPASARAWVTAVALLALLATSGTVLAHAVVFPKTSTPGAYERYVLRVPNERPVPTTRVELAFPAEVQVVSFGDVPGWTLEIGRDRTDRVTGAAWTGEIGVERFVELPFVAVNPQAESRLAWRAVQTYANGERVSWSGAEGSETPASFTEIGPESAGGAASLWVSMAALLLALVGLGVSLRRRGGGSGSTQTARSG